MKQSSRFQVQSLRKCSDPSHKNCMIASMEGHHPKPKGKSKHGAPTEPSYNYTSADQHIPMSNASSFMPGSLVDVHATPVGKKRPVKFGSPDNDGDET